METVVLALSMTYDGRYSSERVMSSGVERCAVPFTIHRGWYVACGAELATGHGLPSMIPRCTMRAPSFDRIISRSLFTLFIEFEGPPINFIAKLTVSGVSQTMIGVRCRAPACLVYLDRDRIANDPPPLNTPQYAFTFSLPILPTYSALFKSPSFFLLFRLFLFYPSCLPFKTATTTRARPLPRLLTEVPQVAPFLSGARNLRIW